MSEGKIVAFRGYEVCMWFHPTTEDMLCVSVNKCTDKQNPKYLIHQFDIGEINDSTGA